MKYFLVPLGSVSAVLSWAKRGKKTRRARDSILQLALRYPSRIILVISCLHASAHLPPSKKEEIAASWPVENGPCVLALLRPVRVGIHTPNTCLLRKLFHSFSSLSLSLSPFPIHRSLSITLWRGRERKRKGGEREKKK